MCQDVNQETGEDLNPYRRKGDEEDISARNPDRPLSMPLVNVPEINEISEKKAIKRVTSPERWELKQMMAANVIDKTELPDFDEDTGVLVKDDESGWLINVVELNTSDGHTVNKPIAKVAFVNATKYSGFARRF